MSDGPQRARLDRVLETASVANVSTASEEWRRCSELLKEVGRALETAARMDVRGSTGKSMKGAFLRSAGSVQEKIERLEDGRQALTGAEAAIAAARTERTALDADNPGMTSPGEFRPDPEKTPEENQTQRGLHQGAVNDYWDRYSRREAEARRIADALDTKYADSVAVMKQIHGEPDPEPQGPGGGNGGRTPVTPVTPGSPVRPPGTVGPPGPVDPPGQINPPGPVHPPGPINPPGPVDPPGPISPPGPLDPINPGLPSIPAEQVGANPGLGSGMTMGGLGLGGGLAAAGLTKAIRGGLAAPGQAVRGTGSVKPIGSTSRAAVSGALGRGGAAGAGSPVTRGAAGRAGGGAGRASGGAAGRGVGAPGQAGTRGAGARGSGGRGAGSRGAGGGRGAGAGAGAAGGRRGGAKDEDEERSERDLFDDGQDWIDDEGATSGVLD